MTDEEKLSSATKKIYNTLNPKHKINPIKVFIYIFDL